jgi:predicted acetylornithine/succinylornithine family transaminase
LSQPEAPAAVEARERVHVAATYARTPFHPRLGRGARLVDADGKEYWDLLAGIAVNVLGYRHPRLVKALRSEAGNVWHVSNLYYHPAPGILAERLTKAARLSRAFFGNSGAEANEAALKFARLRNPGREEVVALEESFHGRTFGALSITGHAAYRTPFAPLLPGSQFVPPNDLASLRSVVSDRTSAIVLEPVLGEAGVVPLTPEYLREARALADRFGATLVFDEVQCGLGRTGTLFAFEPAGIVPDILTLAKPLGGGFPLGATLLGPAFEGIIAPGQHGSTFGGNPVACRLGLALLDEIEEKRLLDRVAKTGAWFGAQLSGLRRRVPAIRDVRGRGLMWGIELDREAGPVARRLLESGFVVGTARQTTLRLLPPYVVPRAALAGFVLNLERLLKEPTA